jgi:hypothetical protein
MPTGGDAGFAIATVGKPAGYLKNESQNRSILAKTGDVGSVKVSSQGWNIEVVPDGIVPSEGGGGCNLSGRCVVNGEMKPYSKTIAVGLRRLTENVRLNGSVDLLFDGLPTCSDVRGNLDFQLATFALMIPRGIRQGPRPPSVSTISGLEGFACEAR